MISKFESNLSPGLRELGFAFKIADAGKSHKPYDFVVNIAVNGKSHGIAVEGKTARGGRFHTNRWEKHQRKALQLMADLDPTSAWVAIHYPHVECFRPVLLPWLVYLEIERELNGSIPAVVWERPGLKCYRLVWDKGPVRKKHYWRIPPNHPIRGDNNNG